MSENKFPELKLDEETRRKLASGEYSISPESGRLRKRVRTRKKKSFFTRRKVKKYLRLALWIILLGGFLVTLIVVGPELNVNPKKKEQQFKNQYKGR